MDVLSHLAGGFAAAFSLVNLTMALLGSLLGTEKQAAYYTDIAGKIGIRK